MLVCASLALLPGPVSSAPPGEISLLGITQEGPGRQGEAVEARPRLGDVGRAYPATTGNRFELLVDGTVAFPRILADLTAAQSSISIIQFGFKDGKLGRDVARILSERSRAGVEVRLIVDRKASAPSDANKDLYSGMLAAGVQVVTHDSRNPFRGDGLVGGLQTRIASFDERGIYDHRKLFVMDGKVAYIGGLGIEDKFVDVLHDVMVRLEGPVVTQLGRHVLDSFGWLGGPAPKDIGKLLPEAPAAGGVQCTVQQNAPDDYLHATRGIHAAIEGARIELTVANPQLSDSGIVDRLCDAAERGVKVRMVLPRHGEQGFAFEAQLSTYNKLLDHGVEVYDMERFVHAKVIIADDAVLVGSVNLNQPSLKKNMETQVRLEGPGVVQAFRAQLFDPDFAQARKVKPARGWTRVKNKLLGQLDRLR